jgi:ubiquinone biosynthesis monooxygenase Coq7
MPSHLETRSTASDPRGFSLVDRLIEPLDQALRTLSRAGRSARPYPADAHSETLYTEAERQEVAALMRINHAGEVAAQALYQGQALVAGDPRTREQLLEAGREEADHLAWCAQRVQELGSRTSVLDPLWYAGSFAIGVLAGVSGDRTSLGFVAETERQVVEHLHEHLGQLPREDARTRAIIDQMSADEQRHGDNAMRAGGAELPIFTRALMKTTAKIMTRTARWL